MNGIGSVERILLDVWNEWLHIEIWMITYRNKIIIDGAGYMGRM